MIAFVATPTFLKNAKVLSKRYPSFKKDLKELLDSLSENPEQGVSLAGKFRKIRLAISSKGKGKRGGARVITTDCVIVQGAGRIVLVSVYDKSDIDSMSVEEIKKAYSSLS
ncbi:MAG: addiction module toxin RelE [Bacteroidales bacterium]|nr:addiction module toxin RelE [Bacteroidales bacterium]